MAITREFLKQHIQTMQAQIAAYNGAIQFAQMLLEEMADDASDGMPIKDLAEAVGGKGAKAHVTTANGNDPIPTGLSRQRDDP